MIQFLINFAPGPELDTTGTPRPKTKRCIRASQNMYLVNPGMNWRISSNVARSAIMERICFLAFPLVALLYVSDNAIRYFMSLLFYFAGETPHFVRKLFSSCFLKLTT